MADDRTRSRQRTEFENALNGARTMADTKMQDQQTEFVRQRRDTERKTGDKLTGLTGRISDLTGQVAQLTTRAELATAAAERNQTAADDLARLRTRLLTALATADPNGDTAALRAQLTHLVSAAEEPPGHDDASGG
jgi:hypothetical protein